MASPPAPLPSLENAHELDLSRVLPGLSSCDVLDRVFKLLDADELARVAPVSKHWNYYTSRDELWEEAVRRHTAGRLLDLSWKAMFCRVSQELRVDRVRRLDEAKKRVAAWQCRVACGMRGPPDQLPHRPVQTIDHSKFPVLGWEKHPSEQNTPVAQISVPEFPNTVQMFYKFSQFISTLDPSESEMGVWLQRYHAFMALKVKHPDVLLVPTQDIEFVWQCHLLRPSMYEADLKRVWGSDIIPHALRASDVEVTLLEDALTDTCVLWKEAYGSPYFTDCEGSKFTRTTPLPPFFVDGFLSAKVDHEGDRSMWQRCEKQKLTAPYEASWKCPLGICVEALMMDLGWFVLFLANNPTGYMQMGLIKRLLKSYDRFLYISMLFLNDKANEMGHPTYAIDLVWHTHMLHPLEYRADCDKYIGMLLDHAPWPKEQGDVHGIANRWEKEFENSIDMEGEILEPGQNIWDFME